MIFGLCQQFLIIQVLKWMIKLLIFRIIREGQELLFCHASLYDRGELLHVSHRDFMDFNMYPVTRGVQMFSAYSATSMWHSFEGTWNELCEYKLSIEAAEQRDTVTFVEGC